VDDAEGRYIEFVKNSLPKGLRLEGITVVVDCANGAAYKVAPTILRELDAKVIVLGDEPDGMNINLGCGSTHPEGIRKAVKEHRADIGIAHDGDADRAVFTTEKGHLVDGDQVMAALAVSMKKARRLNKNTLVTTVMSNMGLDRAMKEAGIRVVKTAVGDRYVLERMLKEGYNFGGEQSGHLIFLDYNTTGDGLITAVQVLALMKTMTTFPQVLVNVRVKERRDLATLPKVKEQMARLEKTLDGSGRLLVRYSGTEPLVRIMIEGERESEIRKWADDLAGSIRDAIGV
jgi:phosphoglucosamine mutase